MPRFFRRLLVPATTLLIASVSLTGCFYNARVCEDAYPSYSDLTGYPVDRRNYDQPVKRHYDQPANVWIESPRATNYLHRLIEKKGRQMLDRQDYECSTPPVSDCPDCLVCIRTVRGANDINCKPEGDLFIRAYIGPGSNVRAMTYWRK